MRQDFADEMPVAAVARKYGVPSSALSGSLKREVEGDNALPERVGHTNGTSV